MSCKVTEDAQILHFRRYNLWWAQNAKKMKKNMRSRLRWSEDVWARNVDMACLCVWAITETRKNPKETWLCLAWLERGSCYYTLSGSHVFLSAKGDWRSDLRYDQRLFGRDARPQQTNVDFHFVKGFQFTSQYWGYLFLGLVDIWGTMCKTLKLSCFPNLSAWQWKHWQFGKTM